MVTYKILRSDGVWAVGVRGCGVCARLGLNTRVRRLEALRKFSGALCDSVVFTHPSVWGLAHRVSFLIVRKRCPDALVSLFGRGELRSKPNENFRELKRRLTCGGVETPNTQKKKLCLLGGSTRAKAFFET